MAKVSYSHNVSDAHLRVVLQRIADVHGRDVSVHSGDRDTVVQGSNPGSLHLAHRAADFHIGGLTDSEVFSSLRAHIASIFDRSEGYEVIRHGEHTNTGGPHVHLGHYLGRYQGSVHFKTEGLSPATKGEYHDTPVDIPSGAQPVHPAPVHLTTSLKAIQHSVGEGGVNEKMDVKTVQHLINVARSKLLAAHRPLTPFSQLAEDGICGRFTIAAILIFQRDAMGMRHPDGNVSPSGPTLRALKLLAGSDVPHVAPASHPARITPNTGGVSGSSSPAQLAQDPRIRAMLDVLGFTEGTGTNYGKIVNGTVIRSPHFPELVGQRNVSITDLRRHPDILVRLNASLQSTAAGRYQFLTTTWEGLNLPDFTAQSQDVGAVMLMQRRRMITPLLQNNLRQAVTNGAPEWASLPEPSGSSHYGGQPARSFAEIQRVYNEALSRYQAAAAGGR